MGGDERNIRGDCQQLQSQCTNIVDRLVVELKFSSSYNLEGGKETDEVYRFQVQHKRAKKPLKPQPAAQAAPH